MMGWRTRVVEYELPKQEKNKMVVKKLVYPDILVGDKVVLREFNVNNLHDERYYLWMQDNDVTRFIGRPEYSKPFSFSLLEDYYGMIRSSGTDMFFAMYIDDVFIGTVKLGHMNFVEMSVDVGVMIGNKHYWNSGIATDAVRTVCNYAFCVLGMRKVTGGCLAGNIAMARCFLRLGFKQEAAIRKEVAGDDHLLYGLFKDELK